MKKIILLLFVSTLQIAFGQCVDLTIKEHFAGEPLFRLESGDIVQICEDSKEISFGGTTLYILTQRGSGGTFIYEFKMDDVYYSPKYGEIQINTNSKKFGITLISGNQGAWTYISETEIAANTAKEAENQRIQIENQNKIDYQRLNADKSNYGAIDKALNANNLQLVKVSTEKLNFPAAYPRYSEYLKKETKEKDRLQKQQTEKIRIELEQKTKEIEKKIQNSLEANDFLLAYETYKTYKTNFNLSSYETVLYNGLTDLYRKDTILLSNEETFNFISSNQKALVNFKEGIYKFYFDTEGKCLNNNQLTSISKIPQKLVGDLNISKLKIGDRYQGNIVIKINESEIVLSSPKPIGSGDFPSAISQCSNFSANNFYWRLPNPEELKSIFSLKNNLDSY